MPTRMIILLVILFLAGMYQTYLEIRAEAKQNSKPAAESQPSVPKPGGAILCQPQFHFADGRQTQQGTGFFAEGPKNKVAAITSIHFLKLNGPALLSAEWLDVSSDKTVATLTKCWGPPGNAGIHTNTKVDVTKDYLILEAEQPVESARLLKLDNRREIPEGELIYFPNKDEKSPQGLTWVTGQVAECTATYVLVRLDTEVKLQSQSGSPVISQATGKVIGTLSRGGTVEGGTSLLLCPAHGISLILNSPVQFTPTKDVIGTAPPVAP